MRWDYEEERTAREVRELVRRVLVEADGEGQGDEEGEASADSEDPDGAGKATDFVDGRVGAVVAALIEQGEVEEVPGEGPGERSDVKYRRLPPVPEPGALERRKGCGRRAGAEGISAQDRVDTPWVDLRVMKPENEEKKSQSSLEKEFDLFFKGVVSEWNPCFSDGGQWRYKWDEEIGAHDVEVDLDGTEGARELTSEEKAVRDVSGRAPERVNLRALLDKVFSAGDEAKGLDVQRVRRLVAALVTRVARHTKHGVQRPKLGVHACARGKDSCPKCRYGFPRDPVARGGPRPMIMEKGDLEGQWHARFPRNDRLCCSYEAHVLLANLGNIDWRPILNLWAVVQYVTKYATKAPKGSRRLQDVLKDAVDEVCTYVPEGEGADFLRRSIQKFFARSLGERDFHLYEAVHLGLQLPMVIPLMPVVSLNTSGSRPLKPAALLKNAGEDEPVHWDSRVDKFNKRLQLVRRQLAKGDDSVQEKHVRDLSLYEFWWKYAVYKGRVKPCTRPVCIMVTPCFSADCANVEHLVHEGYARAAVIAYWRHMPTAERHAKIREQLKPPVKAVAPVCFGGTDFVAPFAVAGAPQEDRYLGVRELYAKFEGREDGWALALMEMLTDPLLLQWVPAWVTEQYERANPFYREVLTLLQAERLERNRTLLKRTKREMIRRHQRHVRKAAQKQSQKGGAASSSSDTGGASEGESENATDADADRQADELAAKLAGAHDEDPNEGSLELLREPRPQAGGGGDGEEVDPTWAARSAAERLSAAGAAPQARDRVTVVGSDGQVEAAGGDRRFGVVFNPKGHRWTEEACNVHWSEHDRIKDLAAQWFGKALVSDGAGGVERSQLDPW